MSMRILQGFASAVALTAVMGQEVYENDILILNDSNFDDAVAKYDYLLVSICTADDEQCKKFAPEFQGAATVLSKQEPKKTTLAYVDSKVNEIVKDRMSVRGYPAVFFFNHGNKIDYSGRRDKDSIIDWINNKSGGATSIEVDCDMMRRSSQDKLALSYFGALEGDVFETFMKGAKSSAINDKFHFYHTSDESCAQWFNTKAPGIALSRTFGVSPVQYTGSSQDLDQLTAFAQSHSVPQLIDFTEQYIDTIFIEHNPALILFSDKQNQDYHKVFAEASLELKGEILFVQSSLANGAPRRLADFVSVKASDLPVLRLISPEDTVLSYQWSGDLLSGITVEQITEFVSDYKKGTLKPLLKSQEINDPETTQGLTTIVGKSWEQNVMDISKDVFVFFHAPWCQYCKPLQDTWADLAKEVEDIEDLVIAKLDGSANEVLGLEVRGYPTLKLYPKGDKMNSIDYVGERQLIDFTEWLSKNSQVYKTAREQDYDQNDEL